MPRFRSSALAVLTALVLCAGHAPAAAQRLPPRLAEVRAAVPAWPGRAPLPGTPASQAGAGRSRPDYLGMVGGGLLAGALSASAAFLVVHGSTRDTGADVAAAMAGGAVGIPVGVHVGNGGRGDPLLTVAASFAAGLGTLFLGAAEVEPAELFVLGTPVAALATAVFVQGGTTR